MTELTEKQASFAAHKVAGCTNRDAAIAAGYAPGSASQAGDRLMKHPGVRTAIKAAGKATPATKANTVPAMPRDSYADAKQFLIDVMNLATVPIAVRADAAKQLLPYQHAKMGETGKKEAATERAKKIARAGRHKFGTKVPPPQLTVVRND